MCYLRDLTSACGHALLVLTKWLKSQIEVMQEQKTMDASASMSIKKARLPCWPLYSQQVSHQRWIWGSHRRENTQGIKSGLETQGRCHQSPKQGISCPTKRTCPPKIYEKTRQFKDIQSNTYLKDSKSRASDPNGKGPGSVLTRIFYTWIFLFSRSKASDANVVIVANFVFVKNRLDVVVRLSLFCFAQRDTTPIAHLGSCLQLRSPSTISTSQCVVFYRVDQRLSPSLSLQHGSEFLTEDN